MKRAALPPLVLEQFYASETECGFCIFYER